MVATSSKTTGTIFLWWVIFLVLALAVALFTWVNGTTDDAQNAGRFFFSVGVAGLVLSLIVLLADKKWRFW